MIRLTIPFLIMFLTFMFGLFAIALLKGDANLHRKLKLLELYNFKFLCTYDCQNQSHSSETEHVRASDIYCVLSCVLKS